MFLQIVMAFIFLAHGAEGHSHAWDARLKALDVQISRLEKVAAEYQDKANDAELQAQPLALRDWSAYAKAMEEAEKFSKIALQTRQQVEELKKQKEQVIQQHQKAHDNEQPLPHL